MGYHWQNNQWIYWLDRAKVCNRTNQQPSKLLWPGLQAQEKYWGKGIATETALISLEYAFNIIKTEEVFAAASVENIVSNKVLQKIGFKLLETFYYEDIKCNWYRIDKKDYENKKTETSWPI